MQRSDFEDLDALESTLWWFVGMRAITNAVLDRFIAKVGSVLDAGCGVGGNLRWAKRYCNHAAIFGIDLEPDAIRFVPTEFSENVKVASVTELPFQSDFFELVTSFDVVVQVLGDDGEQKAISEMYRVLKPGGHFFIRCAAYPWLFSDHDKSLHTQRRYYRSHLVSLLEKQGFSVHYSSYCNFFLLPVAVLMRKVLKPLGLGGSGSDVRPAPSLLDPVFRQLLFIEAAVIKCGISLPFGLSVIVYARKEVSA